MSTQAIEASQAILPEDYQLITKRYGAISHTTDFDFIAQESFQNSPTKTCDLNIVRFLLVRLR